MTHRRRGPSRDRRLAAALASLGALACAGAAWAQARRVDGPMVVPAEPASRTISTARVIGPAGPAAGESSRTAHRLLDTSLATREGTLRTIDDRAVGLADAQGRVRAVPRAEIVAIVRGALDVAPTPTAPAAPAGTWPGNPEAARDEDNDGLPPAEAPEVEPRGEPEPRPERTAGGPALSRASDAAERVRLELVDGQRFIGVLRESADADVVALTHADLGAITIPIDEVARVRNLSAAITPQSGGPSRTEVLTEDALVLANGDRLSGLVDRLGPRVFFTAGDSTRDLPLSRVREIALANPPAPRRGARVWLADGSIARAERLALGGDGLLVLTRATGEGSAEVRVPLAQVAALAFDASTLTPLAELAIADVAPAAGRRWTPPPRLLARDDAPLGLADVELRGPLAIAWDLPAGVRRVAATLELPRSAWAWGRCVVVVSAGGVERARAELSGESPSAALNLELAGATRLELRVESLGLGPVHNTVVVRDGLVLSAPEAAGTPGR